MNSQSDPLLHRSTKQTVRAIHHWTNSLASFFIDKPTNFQFQPGHYARLGLPLENGHFLWRPYSVVSTPTDPQLEFLITLVPGGTFTGLLATMEPGHTLMLESAAMGFFFEPQLNPGEDLWMLATGAGVGPYVSLLRTPSALLRYRRLVLVHSVRQAAELAYADELKAQAAASGGRLQYFPIVTREEGASPLAGRIPILLAQEALQQQLSCVLDPVFSRVMVCGNPGFTADMRQFLNARGFTPCRRGLPGNMLFENYW